MEAVLAFLWAVATDRTKPIELGDIPEDPGLNKLIRSFKDKAEGREARQVSFENSPTRGVTQEGAEAIALSSQTMVLALNRLQESQDEEKARRESKESLLKSMGPDQKELFTSLCTTNMDTAPEMTDFMKELTKSKSPQKAMSLLKAATRDWSGTFSDAGCHRFLSGGFLSTDTNRANPGGFSVFMFFPKYVDGNGKAFDGDTAKLRDYFGLKVEDTTIAYYAKQGYFSPENPHDLHIQLSTMMRTLELVTCKGSIACKGLAYLLDPDRWEGISAMMHDRFRVEPHFGAAFCYSVDRPLQVFFKSMINRDPSDDGDPGYLRRKAQALITAVDEGLGLNVVLPKVLLGKTGTTAGAGPSKDNAEVAFRATSPTKRQKTGPSPDSKAKKGATPHTNAKPFAAWMAPKGSDYMGFFPDRAPNARPWPRFRDKRFDSERNPNSRAVPMCVRFQATGKCSMGCSLAHILREEMNSEEQNTVAKLFKEAYSQNAT